MSDVRVSRSVVEALLSATENVIGRGRETGLVNADGSSFGSVATDLGGSIITLTQCAAALRAALAPAEAGSVEALVPKWEREVAGHRNNRDGGEDWLKSSHYYANGLEVALKDLRAALQPRREP